MYHAAFVLPAVFACYKTDGNLKKESGIYQTTKNHGGGRSQTEHGIGLYSIRTLAEKYNGMSQFSYENGQFCVDVVLKL